MQRLIIMTVLLGMPIVAHAQPADEQRTVAEQTVINQQRNDPMRQAYERGELRGCEGIQAERRLNATPADQVDRR
jgi:hypothetical protein